MATRGDDKPFHHTQVPLDHSALIQSRETGDVLPDDTPVQGNVKALPFAKSWVHMLAGGYVHFLDCHLNCDETRDSRRKHETREMVKLTGDNF